MWELSKNIFLQFERLLFKISHKKIEDIKSKLSEYCEGRKEPCSCTDPHTQSEAVGCALSLGLGGS